MVNILVSLFVAGWVVMGSLWLFGSENCYDDFNAAYVLTMVILVFYYTTIGISLCGMCTLLFTWLIGAGLTKKVTYKFA